MSINILCLETSGKQCSVALSSNGVCLKQIKTAGEWSHSEQITLLIKQLMADLKLDYTDLKAVALSKGPGSYTGLRVGASASKALCYTHDIPLIAIDTLKILAFPLLKALKTNQVIIPLIDARRQEVYYNIYNSGLKPLISTTNLILDENSFKEYDSPIICGDGATKAKDIIRNSDLSYKTSLVEAEFMCDLAYVEYNSENFEDIAYFNPYYLKPPNITTSKKSIF